MTLYKQKMEAVLKQNLMRVTALERHKDFYPLVEELEKVFKKDFWANQLQHALYCNICMTKRDDKTFPLLVKEYVLDRDWIEEAKPSCSRKTAGEVKYYFCYTKSKFSSEERPILQLTIDYSNACRRIVTGSSVIENYEYVCD